MADLTIMCFGDSITYGYCCEYGKDYVSLLKEKVKEDFSEYDIVIRNRGVNGESSRAGLARLDNELESYNPNIVIMLFGSNDSAYNLWYHVGLDEFSCNYDEIITEVQNRGVKMVLITPPPVIEDEEMPFIDNEVLDKYCDIIKSKGKKFDIPVIDMNEAFLKADNGNIKKFLQWDGIHISTEGYRLFFETVYKILEPIIFNYINSKLK